MIGKNIPAIDDPVKDMVSECTRTEYLSPTCSHYTHGSCATGMPVMSLDDNSGNIEKTGTDADDDTLREKDLVVFVRICNRKHAYSNAEGG